MNRRIEIEQLHRVGDAKALTVADHSNAGPGAWPPELLVPQAGDDAPIE
jgi:hypothetical protein